MGFSHRAGGAFVRKASFKSSGGWETLWSFLRVLSTGLTAGGGRGGWNCR